MGIDDMYLGSMPEESGGFEMPTESDDGPPLESGTPLSHVVGPEVKIVSSGPGGEGRAAMVSAELSALGFLVPGLSGLPASLSASFAVASSKHAPLPGVGPSRERVAPRSLPAPSNQ